MSYINLSVFVIFLPLCPSSSVQVSRIYYFPYFYVQIQSKTQLRKEEFILQYYPTRWGRISWGLQSNWGFTHTALCRASCKEGDSLTRYLFMEAFERIGGNLQTPLDVEFCRPKIKIPTVTVWMMLSSAYNSGCTLASLEHCCCDLCVPAWQKLGKTQCQPLFPVVYLLDIYVYIFRNTYFWWFCIVTHQSSGSVGSCL